MASRSRKSRLEALLAEQYDFLRASAARFDDGHHHESKRLALTLRVLLHDTPKSASLLDQLGVKDTLMFVDSDARREPRPGTQVAYPTGWPRGFVGVRLPTGGRSTYFAMLDDDPELRRGELPFGEWWERRVVESSNDDSHWSRRDFVLGSANKEGGGHIDPRPPKWWTDLRDGTWFGAATTLDPSGTTIPLAGLAPAVIRQIAHEVLTSLDRGTGG